ncbi:GNAT family N-acetyltransferase [Streptomyces sp. NPDC005393]|uniref:GNAT family N-acetyltransferase n=1 Tax=Streptomyces sp. NPDC005393 TaxID=3157041 RepID=UPI0033A52386
MGYLVRTVKADEWPQIKELRLAALADPIARIAFNETHERAAAYPDDVWRDRAERSAIGDGITTFVGAADDGEEEGVGRLAGMVVVLVETEEPVPTAHLVAVYVRPEHRGTGLAQQLFGPAIDWSWELETPRIERVRLWVHEENARAETLYGRLGFVRTGRSMAGPKQPSALEYEMTLPRPRHRSWG